jgi:protein-disulfide isomerase
MCCRNPFLAATILLLAAFGSSGLSCPGVAPTTAPTILADDHILGDFDAPVTVVEFSSLRCGFCRQFITTQFADLRERYIVTHKVRWVLRYAINLGDSEALLAAEASECAGDQSKYVEYRDLLFQGAIAFDSASLRQHAESLGLDLTAFDDCTAGGTKEARIRQDVDSAHALGVTGTPTFFIDSEKVVGYRTADEIGVIIDRHLNGGG